MSQPKSFVAFRHEEMVYTLRRSIYGLKQTSGSWKLRFDQTVQGFIFGQNMDEICVYNGKVIVYLILYVDNILLIGNDI